MLAPPHLGQFAHLVNWTHPFTHPFNHLYHHPYNKVLGNGLPLALQNHAKVGRLNTKLMANGFAIESAIDPGCSGINVFFKAVLYLAKWLSLTRVRNSGLTEAEPAGISRTTIVVNAFIGGAPHSIGQQYPKQTLATSAV